MDTYLVFDPEDPLHSSKCNTDSVQEIVSQFENPRVWRITLGHECLDVSADFQRDEPDEEADHRAYLSHTAWERSMAPRVL